MWQRRATTTNAAILAVHPSDTPSHGLCENGGQAMTTTAIRLDSLPTPETERRARPPDLGWARGNHRRHWVRDLGRLVVLAASDLGTVAAVGALIRGLSDHGLLGEGLRERLNVLVGAGTLGGWHFPVAMLLALAIARAYGPRRQRHDVGRILGAVAVAALMMVYPQAWEQSVPVAALRLAAVIATFTPALVLSRSAVEAAIGRLAPSVTPSRLVVVSAGATDWADPATFAHRNGGAHPRFRVVATVSTNGGSPDHALSQLAWVIDQTRADTVVMAGPLSDRDFAFVVDTALANGCRLLAAPRTTRIAGVAPRAVWERGTALVELTAPTLQAWYLAAKRVMDICCSGLALVVLSPVLAGIAALVKLESRGPAIFAHRRLGAQGRTFPCYKFRSMRPHAERVLRANAQLYRLYVDNNYKLPPHLDPRLTRIGVVLRKFSLDELPQLFNVLLGHMSVVGPRPIVIEELSHYGQRAPLLLSRKPGLTGNWAANGRSDVGYPDRANMEIAYTRQWSLVHDVGLILRTFPVVARGSGAH
jgi:exopolysaccharide production protein ExoY